MRGTDLCSSERPRAEPPHPAPTYCREIFPGTGSSKRLKKHKPQGPEAARVQQLSSNSTNHFQAQSQDHIGSIPAASKPHFLVVCSSYIQTKGNALEGGVTQELSVRPSYSSQQRLQPAPGCVPLRHAAGSIPVSAVSVCGPRRAWREGVIGRAGAGAAREGEAWLGAPAVCQTDKPEGGPCRDAGKRGASPVPGGVGRARG